MKNNILTNKYGFGTKLKSYRISKRNADCIMNNLVEKLEVTTKIGCPVNCKQYCPQNKLLSKYIGQERLLSFEAFKKALSSVPKNVRIVFSGFCEPFANPSVLDMIEYAYSQGYVIQMFTTLFQATKEQVERLVKIEFEQFVLHLPDGQFMNIPTSQEYMENFFTVVKNVKNASLMIMNDNFRTNHREEFNNLNSDNSTFMPKCNLFESPGFVMLPNGDLQLCCNDFTLSCKVGNLLSESYLNIRERYLSLPKKFPLCYGCKHYRSLGTRCIDNFYVLLRSKMRRKR
jgi:hypothetical protein